MNSTSPAFDMRDPFLLFANHIPAPADIMPTAAGELGRKRTLSSTEDDDENDRKRLKRTNTEIIDIRAPFIDTTIPIPPRLLRDRSQRDAETSPERPRLSHRQSRQSLSRASSMSAVSRAGTPAMSQASFSQGPFTPTREFRSDISFRSNSPMAPLFPETSARHHLRNGKVSIDFSGTTDSCLGMTSPVSWSLKNIVIFGRGNRVYLKNLSTSEDVVGLAKLKEDHGVLRLLECADEQFPNTVALATSQGYIQVWDLAAQKIVSDWRTKPVTAMKWSGSILAVGGEKGSIRHFDTRIKEKGKMKDQAKKVLRHQARISSLAWNHDGRILASGDESGVIYCWDSRKNAPLDVGDLIQRRRKMQHDGCVRALSWCPWSLKTLSSGDAAENGSGTIRLWNVNESSPNALIPDTIRLDAQVTSLQWSTQCKELLSTHSIARSIDEASAPAFPVPSVANAVMVHSYPSLSHVVTEFPAKTALSGSVLSPNGQKIIFAVPEEKQLKIWDVWGKRKEIRRQRSLVEGPCGIR
ncbi:WD40 repeat-like protein [Dentipellis sp. KUC8613]|nr:WD40 repeat-like protein [Dentipellis sp. KUC8613]